MRTGCWVREKTCAKSKVLCPPHQPCARAWVRSSECSAEMSVPMLNWLEMLRAPSAEGVGGTAHRSQSTYSVPGAENMVVQRPALPSWGGRWR